MPRTNNFQPTSLRNRSASEREKTGKEWGSPIQERLRAEVCDGDGVAEGLGAPNGEHDLPPSVVHREEVRGRHRPVSRLAPGESHHLQLAGCEAFPCTEVGGGGGWGGVFRGGRCACVSVRGLRARAVRVCFPLLAWTAGGERNRALIPPALAECWQDRLSRTGGRE